MREQSIEETLDNDRMAHTKSARAAGRGGIAVAIAKACEQQRAGQTYGALGALLKSEFSESRRRALAATKKGDVIAKRLSAFVNSVIRALHQEGAKAYPQAAEKVAICAIGGYGRDRIAPHSDIDLLFLHNFSDDEKIKPFLDFILYPLWDAGLTVGQGVHTAKSAIEFAKNDIIGRTAYLDARFVAGDRSVFDNFAGRFDKLRQKTINKFVQAKLEEQEQRHFAAQRSRLLAEPDLKEGRGGLRDLQTMRWLYSYAFKADIAANGAGNEILDAREMKDFLKAEQFFWSLRAQLHDLRDRANELVTFDVQPELAERLGYADRPGVLPAERMMKHYFVNVNAVRRLTRLFITKLEERIRKRPFARQSPPKELMSDEAAGKPNIALRYGRIDFQSPQKAVNNPRDFFRLFRAYSKRPEFGASPWALALIAQNAASITSQVRRDPVNCALFLATLMKSKAPAQTLRVMAEAGLLGKMAPFFGMIAGRVEFGLYRQYPLDEQIFQAIEVLSLIRQGKQEDGHPVATKILKAYPDPSAFYLLVLLYEAWFSLKDPTDDDIKRFVRREARRLGANEASAKDIAFASIHLRSIISLALRRSLLYAPAIAGFARMVGTKARLDLLLVLAACHLRVVSSTSWDSWVRRQLSELYEASSVWLDEGDEGLEAWLAAQTKTDRAAAVKALGQWTRAERDYFLSNVSDDFLRRIDNKQLKRFASLSRAADVQGLGAGVDVHVENGFCEAMVYADDREGLLADLSGAVASIGLGVRRMQALTTPKGKALDLFTLETGDFGDSFEDVSLLRRVHQTLLESAKEPRREPFNITKRLGDRRAIFTVTPIVRIDKDASEHCVVIEAEGRDRPGLLHKLANALTEAKVIIDSAYVVTRGARAVDAFYLKDSDGRKITNTKRLQTIERRLMDVLVED